VTQNTVRTPRANALCRGCIRGGGVEKEGPTAVVRLGQQLLRLHVHRGGRLVVPPNASLRLAAPTERLPGGRQRHPTTSLRCPRPPEPEPFTAVHTGDR